LDADAFVDLLTRHLHTALEADEFDLTLDPDTGEIDLSTDDWTLKIERWPGGPAWLAIDDEPDDPVDYRAARRAVMTEASERALAAANLELDGALSDTLVAGSDPFSQDLGVALREAAAEM
jgi:hypothetical protein